MCALKYSLQTSIYTAPHTKRQKHLSYRSNTCLYQFYDGLLFLLLVCNRRKLFSASPIQQKHTNHTNATKAKQIKCVTPNCQVTMIVMNADSPTVNVSKVTSLQDCLSHCHSYCLCLFDGQVMFPHHTDQMYQLIKGLFPAHKTFLFYLQNLSPFLTTYLLITGLFSYTGQ